MVMSLHGVMVVYDALRILFAPIPSGRILDMFCYPHNNGKFTDLIRDERFPSFHSILILICILISHLP